MITYDELYIGGRWVAPSSADRVDVVNPATEEVVGRAPLAAAADVDAAVRAASESFHTGGWRERTPAERAAVLSELARLYQERMLDLADLVTSENGSPKAFAHIAQTPTAWMALSTYAQLADAFPWEEARAGALLPEVLVRHEPVGVVAAIVPWNVPQFLIMTKLAPALLAGCSIVLKPAPETPLDALALGELLDAAGVPEGVVSIVPADREVGEHLVRHELVDKVAFTGSTAAGRRVASLCGERLTRCTLELGGKSAAIVLDDVDASAALTNVVMAGLMNSGQACVAQTRLLLPRSRYDELVDGLAAVVDAVPVGDPTDETTTVGPMSARRQQERVESYIAKGIDEGARLVVGGTGRPKGIDRGWYVRPTLFADVSNDMTIAREEIFGPVLSAIPYDDEADAVAIANDSDYGLAGTVWTTDTDRGIDIARRVRTGTYGVNGFLLDFNAPYGGFKCSGIGRELGPEGLRSYLEPKSIAVLG